LYKRCAQALERSYPVYFVALSETMMSRLIESGVAPSRIAVIPNAVCPEDIGLSAAELRPARRLSELPLKLLFVGRLSVEKGVDILIDAAKLLASRGCDFRLHIVGQGGTESDIRFCFNSHAPLLGRVHLLGHCQRDKLGALYRQHDFLAVPSRDETFSLVALESLLAGTPVLAARIGGLTSLIDEGVNGAFVSPNTPETWADVLSSFYRRPTRISELAAGTVPSVWPRYSWPNVRTRLRDFVAAIASTAS
jgi:D-inositol-3-phosphate glycosyltransferase